MATSSMEGEEFGLTEMICQIPDLIESNKELSKSIQALIVSFGTAIKQRLEATIPEQELAKVTNKVMETVGGTQCKLPDATILAETLGAKISEVLAQKIKDTVADTEMVVTHKHEHVALGSLWNVVDEKSKKWIKSLCWTIAVLLLVIGGMFKVYYSSELYWGKRYVNVFFAKETTDAERIKLKEECHYVSFIPNEFKKNPKKIKDKIRRREMILEDRKSSK